MIDRSHLVLRPATAAEHKFVSRTFVRSLLEHQSRMRPTPGGEDRFVPIGRNLLSPKAIRLALEAYVVPGAYTVVELGETPGALLGWIAWSCEPYSVQYLYVVPKARRMGLGTALYDHALSQLGGAAPRFGAMTSDGEAFLRARGLEVAA